MTTGISTSHEAALDVGSRWRAVPLAEDAVRIQNLIQVYALYGDAGRVEDLATLFTDDASWDGTELDYGTAEGPIAIAQRVAGHFRPEEPMMHLPGPALLTAVSDDEVHSVCWCLATRWTNGVPIPHIHFTYSDEIRRGADGTWRFRRRYLRRAAPRPSASG
jgi:hypothetical protein